LTSSKKAHVKPLLVVETLTDPATSLPHRSGVTSGNKLTPIAARIVALIHLVVQLFEETEMHRAGIAVVSFVVSLAGIGGCATQAETVGAATGAAVGAAVGGGSAVGTLGGAMVGFGAGKAYDQRQNR
jgi:hypothetical protein